MDTKKEKPILEKSNSISPTTKKITVNKDDQDSSGTSYARKHTLPLESTTVDEGENLDDKDVQVSVGTDQIKEEEAYKSEELATISNVEEPPVLPHDLNKVSEEIDQYISSLSSSEDDESLHTYVPLCVEQFVVLVESRIEGYDGKSPVKWTQLNDEESTSFLEAINRVLKLSTILSKFSYDFKYAYSINYLGGVLQRGLSYLEEEFKLLLEDHKISDYSQQINNDPKLVESVSLGASQDEEHNSEPESHTLEEKNVPKYPKEIISNLNRLAKCMIEGGYETECCQAYFLIRQNTMEESIQKLGFETHSIDDVQKMQWESLEREIVTWIKVFNQCMSIEFPSERNLSNAVFSNHLSISNTLFSSLSRGVMTQLLNFAEATAMNKRAAEKLFKFLDVYETLRDALPRMEKLFIPKEAEEIKSYISLIKSRFGEGMVIIFYELENSIKADNAKTPVPGGVVHPLTRYTMNYLKYACEYKDTLEQVFKEHQKIERTDLGVRLDFDYNSEVQDQSVAKIKSLFQIHLVRVMDILDVNLEAKSKLYKDISLNSIFMMNNGRYIFQKVRSSQEMNSLVGDTWCRKRSSDLRQYHKNYQWETCGKLLNCLVNHERLNVNGKVVKPILKDRLKNFNAIFDEIHKTQSAWVVTDDQLQSELRVSVSNMVIPAYRAFLARYGQVLTPGRQTEKYVKYQPEDIETYINELFDGTVAVPIGRRKL